MALLLVVLHAEGHGFFALIEGGVAIEEVTGVKARHL